MQDVRKCLTNLYPLCVVQPLPKRYENGQYGVGLYEVISCQSDTKMYFKMASAHEVEVVKTLDHPCIAKYGTPVMWRNYDLGGEALLPVCMYKEDLYTLLEREKKVESAFAERIIGNVWSACEYMHREHGLIHGDVKLNNICLDDNDRAVLIDFDRSTKLCDRTVMKRNTEYHHGSTEDGRCMEWIDDLYACIVVAIKLVNGAHHVVRTPSHSQMFNGEDHVHNEWILRMVHIYNTEWIRSYENSERINCKNF